ncbi:hypothetical protein NPIL_627021 [Nephila pilipes]|uniref:Uncharacterized protein n=1 Tax=Nephila pilipes TaxID=299642 RepID=A0A8X6MWQ0_NEPPI|nr:hypothetical protein NPIL_627021 [Nephila pilipes]
MGPILTTRSTNYSLSTILFRLLEAVWESGQEFSDQDGVRALSCGMIEAHSIPKRQAGDCGRLWNQMAQDHFEVGTGANRSSSSINCPVDLITHGGGQQCGNIRNQASDLIINYFGFMGNEDYECPTE